MSSGMRTRFSPTKFAQLRRRAKLTPQELAERLGVAYPTVWRWEAGQSIPSTVILDLAEVLGCTPRALTEPIDSDTELS